MPEARENLHQAPHLRQLMQETDLLSVSAAIATITAVGTALGLSGPLISLILEDRGYTSTMIGANTAMAGIAAVLAVPFVTPIAKLFGVVNTLIGAILLTAVFFVAFFFTQSIAAWFVLRFVFSVGVSVSFVLSEFWINSAAQDSSRGLVLGIYATVLSLGFAIGPAILSMVGIAGFAAFGIGATLIAASVVPAWAARHRQPVFEARENTPSIMPYLFLVPLATMAAFVFGSTEQIEIALLPIFAISYGYTEQAAALLLTVVALGNLAFQIPLGMMSDRVADRRSVLLFCAVVGAAGAILYPLIINHVAVLVVCLFVTGGVIAGMYTVGLAHLGSRLSGEDLAQANGAFIMAYAIGMMVGPQVCGILMDLMGPPGFAVGLILFFALFLLLYAIRAWQR